MNPQGPSLVPCPDGDPIVPLTELPICPQAVTPPQGPCRIPLRTLSRPQRGSATSLQ